MPVDIPDPTVKTEETPMLSPIPTPTPAGVAMRSIVNGVDTAGDIGNAGFDDVTDNDPLDEGLKYLATIYKHGKIPTKEDYAYADKVREGKINKALKANMIKNTAFWLYMIFNFALTVFNLFIK
jgi:hypothetical protein